MFSPQKHINIQRKNEKNEKFEYFEDLFHSTLRMQPNLSEEMKITQIHSHLIVLTLKTFENIQRTPSTTLKDFLKVFGRKYVKPEASASEKHSFNRFLLTSKTKT